MKLVIYYEGPSEEAMLKNILFKSSQQIDYIEDDLDFRTCPDNRYSIHFYSCLGYQNVFPYVEESKWLYTEGEAILIVRDLENTPCYTELKAELTKMCTNLPRANLTRLLFSKPQFEQVYFADLSLFEQVFLSFYSSTYGKRLSDLATLRTKINSLNLEKPEASIRALFRDYGLAFNKRLLAQKFFGQFDFLNSTYPYIQRLVKSLEELL